MSADIDYQDPLRGKPGGRHAFEWGLSSLFLGSVLILMFPLSLVVIALGGALAMNWPYWDADNLRVADTVARVVGYSGVAVAGLAVLLALFGLLRGLVQGQPLGACVGGLVISLIALLFMVMLTVVIHTVSREFYRELPHRTRSQPPPDFRQPP
jgi:hypothetical protein